MCNYYLFKERSCTLLRCIDINYKINTKYVLIIIFKLMQEIMWSRRIREKVCNVCLHIQISMQTNVTQRYCVILLEVDINSVCGINSLKF